MPGLRLDGVTVSEAIRLQGEARVHFDYPEDEDDDLRLHVERPHDERWRWPTPSRTAIITLWIVGLIAALAIASYAQLLRQRNAETAMDAPPPPAEAAPAAPQTPIPPPAPALSEPAPIAAGATTQDSAAAPAPQDAPDAEAAAPAPSAKVTEGPAAKAQDVAAEPAKTEKAKAETAKAEPAKTEKDTHKTSAAVKLPDNIVPLRRKLDHAYAQAVKAGVPKSVMKAREAEWTRLYAKARKKSPEAVAELYRTRTSQLAALAKKHHATSR